MYYFSLLFLCVLPLSTVVYGQLVDLSCFVERLGSAGKCQLLTDCPVIRDDIIKNQRLPQICGFRDTQPIVCCPQTNKPGDISKRKCKEYSSHAGKKCGIHRIVKRIIGGEVVGDDEFGHMALLGYEQKDGKIRWICGGSIISERYILTAGHCLENKYLNGQEVKYVKVGLTEINNTEHKQELRVAQKIVHSDFTQQYFSDIGLIRLEKPIEFNSYVRPACLYSNYQVSAEKAVAIGWGTTENGYRSDKLLKVTLDLVDIESCNTSFKSAISKYFPGLRIDSQLCAGTGKNNKDVCSGDAGGPLQIIHEGDGISCMYDIVGVSSFGSKHCGLFPGVYTRISYFLDWIEKTVWPEK